MVRSEAAFPTKEGKERSRFPDKRGEGAKPLSRQKRGRSEAACPTKEGKERSRFPDKRGEGAKPLVLALGRASDYVPSSGKVNPIPVSYTHLRAHETRHDLVCRLLLEKK